MWSVVDTKHGIDHEPLAMRPVAYGACTRATATAADPWRGAVVLAMLVIPVLDSY